MGSVTGLDEVSRIRRELAEYDLAHSRDPLDRRRAEKEAEAREQKAREAHEQQTQSKLMAAVEHRIGQWFSWYFLGWDDESNGDPEHQFGVYTWGVTQHLGENRREDRDWVKQQIEQERHNFEARIAELEARLKSVPGKLPVAKTWREESVTYCAEMVAHKGSLWQARKDTAQAPGGSDWVCVARHGRDAITPCVCGDYDAHENYAELDIVSYDGASYIARSDNPGIPGHDNGWQVFGSERMDRHAEVKAAIEEERQSFDARLAALEQASIDRWAGIDQRIVQHIERARESVLHGTTEVVGQFRAELHEEFKRALDEKERAFEARLAALEQESNDRWAVVDQRIDQSIERAREPLLQGTNEVLGRFRDELREFKHGLASNERAFDAKLAELVAKEDFDKNIDVFEAKVKAAIATCERAAAEMRSSIPAMIDEAVGKHVTQAMTNIQRSLEPKEDFDKNFDLFEAKVKAAIATCERAAAEIRSSIPTMIDEAVAKHVTQAMANIRQPADGAKGEKGDPGCLPMVQSYIAGKIYYRGDAVADSTGTYQAKCDTARAPSPESEDWTCVARAGRDGRTPTIRGTFDVHESYAELDIVSFDGAAYIARSDNPGLCPGDGWEPLSKRGKQGLPGEAIRGPQGEKGARGDKGDDALAIINWHIDAPNYRAVPFMSNGQPGPALDLRPLFERYLEETGGQT